MSKIITIPFTEDFIEHLADYLYQEYFLKGKDLRSLTLIFGGQRPALFLKKALSKRIKGVFYPPTYMTIDQWIDVITNKDTTFKRISVLDHYFIIYQLAKQYAPALLKGKERFCAFLPWAKEIYVLIEQLDLELSSQDVLQNLKAQAQIGFDIPEDISKLLESLFVIRAKYHQYLDKEKIITRGFQYLKAATSIEKSNLSVYEEIIFCNFFYLHRTEMKVVEYCYQHANTTMMMQGDQRRWPALKRISTLLGQDILEGNEVIEGDFQLNCYKAFDNHSQAAMVKSILQGIKNPHETVIVLPHSGFILPLLSFLSEDIKEFNVSMGYPLNRSAVYSLLEKIFSCQKSKQEKLYYTRDYLRVLHHPLVKDLSFNGINISKSIIGVIKSVCHGEIKSPLTGQLYLDLKDLLHDSITIDQIKEILTKEGMVIDVAQIKLYLEAMHHFLFEQWENLDSFAKASSVLLDYIYLMQQHSQMELHPFNAKISQSFVSLAEELSLSQMSAETFLPVEIFRIIEDSLSNQMVSFTGSPLRGLQVLGLFETRSLTFKNVIVVDVNEGVLPNLNIYEPLIPRDIMIKLDLDRLELEEEIQRYGFMRLISSAKNGHLRYQERHDRIRSRFVEELVWNEERKQKKLEVVTIQSGRFDVKINSTVKAVPKTPAMIDFLKNMRYSASSLNTYLRNPYEFYENYCLGLRQTDNLLEDPQGKQVGTFLHELLEKGFKQFVGRKPLINEEFKKHFMDYLNQLFEVQFGSQGRSDAFLLKKVITTRMERFLLAEEKRCLQGVESIVALEQKFNHLIKLSSGDTQLTYRIDRIDKLSDGSMLILDYKSGGTELMPRSIDELLEGDLSRELIRDRIVSFQMPLYIHYLQGLYPGLSINAAFYHLRTNKIEKVIKTSSTAEIETMVNASIRALDFIITEILNPAIPFIDSPVELFSE